MTNFDLTDLPVTPELRGWLADALAKGCGPSGSARTLASARGLFYAARLFARYLAALDRPPAAASDLRGRHWDEYLLAQKETRRRTLSVDLKSLLRHADDVPALFAARMQRTVIARPVSTLDGYSVAEFRRITAASRSHVHECIRRIQRGRAVLGRWRAGLIDPDTDKRSWERGWLLDHIDRFDQVPRYPSGTRHHTSTAHGGTSVLFAQLYPTASDIGAAAVLLICMTGHNLSTLSQMPARHHRPDGGAGGSRTALVETVKPRRGARQAEMTVALHDPASTTPERTDLRTPFAVYEALLDIAGPARERAGSDLLFAYFTAKSGLSFLGGMRRNVVAQWARSTGILSDTLDDSGGPSLLQLDSRRLRTTWLEVHQRPVAHTEQTLANEYLTRNRGSIAEYQQIVSTTLDEQIALARRSGTMHVLTTKQIEQARANPQSATADLGLTPGTVSDLIDGRLDTVVAGCVDNLNSPYSAAGQPCRASFLLCLSCPCARATPAHLPVITAVHDALLAKKNETTPLRWAQRFAAPATQLSDVLRAFPAGAVADARANVTESERHTISRLFAHELDAR